MEATFNGAYTKVRHRFWPQTRRRRWSRDMRYLALYLLTSPHVTLLGCYELTRGYMLDDTGMTPAELDAALTGLTADGFVQVDADNDLVLVTNYLEKNPIENPNQAKAATRLLVCAWAADGVDRDVTVTLPGKGAVTVHAMRTGNLVEV